MSISTQLQQLLRTLLPDKGFKTAGHHRDAIIAGVEEAKTYTDEKSAEAVKKTGNETIAGVKTFTDGIVGNVTGNASTVTNGVYNTGDQTIGGTKTFTSAPVVPDATLPQHPIALNQGVVKTQIKQTTGTSEIDLMSQKAVTDKLANKADKIKLDQLADELALKEDSFFKIKSQKGTSFYDKVVHIKKAISGIYLNGPVDENTYDYSLTVYSNNSSYRRLRVFKTNKSTLVVTEICALYVYQTTPYLLMETVNVPEYNSSGYSAIVTLDWSKCQGVDYMSLVNDIWILTNKAFNLTQLNQSHSNKGLIDNLANNAIATRLGPGYRWRQFVNTSTYVGSITDLQDGDVFISTDSGTVLFVPNVNVGDIIIRSGDWFKPTGDVTINAEKEYLEIKYPAESDLIQLQAIKKAVLSIWLDGPIDTDADYCLAVYSNNSDYRRLRFFSVKDGVNTEICSLHIVQSSPRTIIETITIPPYNSSGFTVKVLVDWSKCQEVNYIGLFASNWILSEKCFSEANFKYDIYNKNLIDNTLLSQSKKTENLIDGVNQLTLTNWILTNGIVQSQATGWSNYASFNKNLNEDKFSMSVKLKELSTTYFEMGIGRRASASGTAITLRKDATGSYICFWGMLSSTSPTELTGFRQTLAKPLVSGDEYILKMTKDVNNMKVDLIYPDGDIVTYSTSSLNYFSWGYPSIYCITGQCQASEFYFSMPYSRNRDPKLLVFGDSFIEGNSISGQKELRYVSLLANDLGSEEVVIMGKGGESTTSVLNRFYQQVDWFSQAKYCLLALITNDTSFSTAKANILNMVAYLENYEIIPILVTCTYRGNSNDNNSVLQAAWNSWVRSSGYKYIDMSLAVSEPGDETIWRSGFQLQDLVHPSITGHEYMYRRIKFDAQYLFKS